VSFDSVTAGPSCDSPDHAPARVFSRSNGPSYLQRRQRPGQSGCLISDRDRLTTFEADVHHAAHVVIPGLLVTVLIAQVDVHEGDVIAESAQSILGLLPLI